MGPTPRFIQGIFQLEGKGLDEPTTLGSKAAYAVPPDKRAQLIYMRCGNSSDELACLFLMRNGKMMRLFPVGAKSCLHVPLSVVEDIFPESKLELLVSAPKGVSATIVVDIGLLEVD